VRGKATPDGDGLLSIVLGASVSWPAPAGWTVVLAQTGLHCRLQRWSIIVS
jgi:hypothetical protein